MNKDPFVLDDVNEYQRDIDPLGQSVEQYANYLAVMEDIPHEKAVEFVRKSFKRGGVFEFKDTKMVYLDRAEQADREVKETTVHQYIRSVLKEELILAPTWTAYIPSKKEVSILAAEMQENIDARNRSKKAEHAAEAKEAMARKEGNHAEAEIQEAIKNWQNVEQKGRKGSNNSTSGAQCTGSTVLFNPTGHSTLTSTCRSTSAYGNANNERLLSGNRHYRDLRITLNNINSIVANTNYKLVRGAMEKYDLVYPSVEQALACVRYSSDMYWSMGDRTGIQIIQTYLSKLSPIQRAAIVYTGDLHQVQICNPDFTREMIRDFSRKITGVEVPEPKLILKKAPENFILLAHQICTKEMMDIGMDYDKLSEADLHTVAATVLHIGSVCDKYFDFIRAFITTKNLPPSVAYFPRSIRRSAVTSDTDSTIYTVQDWVMWYFGKITFSHESIAVQAVLNFFSSSSIRHVLAVMSVNFGVDHKYLFKIAMKSEFRFDVFVVTMLGKHYFALIGFKEGNVYSKHKVEIKGVHLKSSQITKLLTQASEAMMVESCLDLMRDGQISIAKYLTRVADIERDVMSEIRRGNKEYLKAASIKDADGYKKSAEESPYQHHDFWNATFGRVYGLMPEPPYRTLKLSLKTTSPRALKAWLESIEHPELKERLISEFVRREKKDFSTFYIPEEIFDRTGVPKEISGILDVRKTTIELCTSFYLVLECMDYFFVGEKRVARMVSDYY